MVDVKEMPYHEKYNGILELIKLLKGFAPKFVNEELGQAKADELLKIWAQESEPIPSDTPFNDKYNIAHRNFLQNWITALNFVNEHHVDPDKYMKVAIDAWGRKYASSSLGLKIFRRFSSGEAAFEALAKRLAYSLQIFGPFTVSELNQKRMVLTLTPCKIRTVRGRDDFCLAACQNIIPAWLERQFNVKTNHRRDGNNCSVTIEPY
jgi:hypothetical protein